MLLFLASAGIKPGDVYADIKPAKGSKVSSKPFLGLPPEASPVKTEVLRGGQVAIKLHAATSAIGPIEFLIRDQPKFGRLGPILNPVSGGGQDGSVMYVMNPKVADSTYLDRFTFVARVPGQGVSVPAEVLLSFIDRKAVLTLDFIGTDQPVPIGEPVKQILRASNTGNGAFSCELDPPAPWHTPYRFLKLKPGEMAEIPLIFNPGEPKWQSAEWVLGGRTGSPTVRLTSEAIVPFTAQPSRLNLSWDANANRNTGSFYLRNWGNKDTKLFITTSDSALKLPREIAVAAGATIPIELSLAEGRVEAFTGSITIQSPVWKLELPVTAAALPAHLAWKDVPESDGKVDFGQVKSGSAISRSVTVRNTGGEEAFADWKLSPGFQIAGLEGAIHIPPVSEITLQIVPDTSYDGIKNGKLEVKFKDQNLEMPIHVIVADSDAEVARMRNDLKALMEKEAKLKQAEPAAVVASGVPPPVKDGANFKVDVDKAKLIEQETKGITVVQRYTDSSVPQVSHLEVVNTGGEWADLTWDRVDDPGISGYIIETRVTEPDEKKERLIRKWLPFQGPAEVRSRENGRLVVRISKLMPQSRYVFRVITKEKGGRCFPPTDPFVVITTENKLLLWPWYVGGAVVLIWLIHRWRRRAFLNALANPNMFSDHHEIEPA